MARQKKDYTPLSAKLSKDVYDRLQKYCEESGLTKTMAIERALDKSISEYEENKKILEENESFKKG